MTSGGVTSQQRWLEVGYFPFEALHKQWPYHLCTMVKARVGPQAMQQPIDALWRQYPHGLGAYVEKGKVPPGGQGWGDSLGRHQVGPPRSPRGVPCVGGRPG